MKLLFCDRCFDVRKLPTGGPWGHCECGNVMARYMEDNLTAEWNGAGFLLGFANSSLAHAVALQRSQGDPEDGKGRVFEAFVIPVGAPSVRVVKP